MTDISNKTVTVLLLLVLAVVIVGTSISVSELSRLGTRVATVTGAVTESGTAAVDVAGSAGISLSGTVNFGSGFVNQSTTVASIYSDGPQPAEWINTSPFGPVNFTITNNGSTLVVLNATSLNRASAEAMLGGTLASSTARLALRALNVEANSCTASGNIQSNYTNLLTDTANLSIQLCDEFDYRDAADSMQVAVNVTVPNDARAGNRTLTITFEGTAAP